LKKNKLVIREELGTITSDPIYFVEDAYTLYCRTRNLNVAKQLYKELKLEYQREQENASKV
jgi:hypothetical protein